MPIDASIPLSVQAPKFADPLEQAGKVASLSAMRQNAALNAERLKAEQLQNQETELKRKDDTLITQAYQQAGGDPKKTVSFASQAGARPGAVQALEKHFADIREQYAKTSKDEADVAKYKNSQLAGLTGQAAQDPNLAQNWAQYKQQALQIDPNLQLPDQAPTPEALQHIRLGFTTDEMLRAEAEELRKQAGEKRAAELFPAQKREAEAKAAGTELSTAMSQKQQDASALAQAAQNGTLGQALAQLTPERRAPFAGIAANSKPEDILRVGMTPEQQTTAANQAATRTEQARHDQAMEKHAAAQTALAQGHLDIARKTFEATYGAGANPFLVGVEPKLRTQAAKEAMDASKSYLDAASAANDIKTFIDAARSGNKEAYAYMPTEGVLAINTARGVKRINRTEIEQYGGAGSLFDALKGKLGKATRGASISSDVLKDMESLHQQLAQNAAAAANKRIDAANTNYHSNFPHVKEEQSAANGPKPGTVEEGYRFKGGDPSKPENWEKVQ